MPSQDTITLHLGTIEIPAAVLIELVRRHLLRSLRLSPNGNMPNPSLEPQEEPAPAVPLDDGPVPTSAGAP